MTSSKSSPKLLSLTELRAHPLPFEDVPVPEYGDGSVRLYAISGLRRAELTDEGGKAVSPGDNLRFVHEVIAAALGEGATAEEVALLPSTVVDRLGQVALGLAGLGDDAPVKADARLKAPRSAGNG